MRIGHSSQKRARTELAPEQVTFFNAMKKQQHVLFFGNSLLIAGVAAELSVLPEFIVTRIDPLHRDVVEYLRVMTPDVLILDLATACGDTLIACLTACPETLLIGLDVRSNQGIIFSSLALPLATVRDLAGVIRQRVQV